MNTRVMLVTTNAPPECERLYSSVISGSRDAGARNDYTQREVHENDEGVNDESIWGSRAGRALRDVGVNH